MATYTPTRLYLGQPGTSEGTLATVPGSTTWIVKQVHICNTTAVAATFSLSVVPSGGSASAANRIASSLTVPGNGVMDLDMAQVMATGDFFSGLQGTSVALTLIISGAAVT